MSRGERYAGESGRAYFEWQTHLGRLGATLDRWKFLPHVSSDDAVVDFGCGGGWLLASLPASRRIGIDVNPAARAAAAANGLEVHESAAQIAAGSMDVVLVHHVLEHTDRPLDELQALRRLLRPGGRLVCWTSLHDWRIDRRDADNVNFHLYTWTPLLLDNLLTASGFAVDDVRVVAHAWSTRFAGLSGRVPRQAFDALCRLTAVLRRRRELCALAHVPRAADVVAEG